MGWIHQEINGWDSSEEINGLDSSEEINGSDSSLKTISFSGCRISLQRSHGIHYGKGSTVILVFYFDVVVNIFVFIKFL